MPWGRAGSVTYISQKSDSDKLLLVHFPTTRLHCSNTLAAEGAHPQLSGPRNGHGGLMSLRKHPNYFPGESSDLQLNVLPRHSRKTNRQQTPKGCTPGRSCSFQGWQLPPGAQLQMVGGSGTASLESERFPREKGSFEARTRRGHCCQADSRHWFLAGICFLERMESSVKRSGKATCLSCGHRSASPAATAVQFPAEENYCTSKRITSFSQRNKYQLQIKPSHRHPAHRTSPQHLLLQ